MCLFVRISEFTNASQFHDVFKMTLKPRIAPGSHILFTVYNVNTKSGGMLTKVTNTLLNGLPIGALKQVVGFAFTSVDGGAINPASALDLPLYQQLPAEYLTMPAEALEPYRILPAELPLRVSLTYQSTIQPKHPHLIDFFRDYTCFSSIMDVFATVKGGGRRESLQKSQKDLHLTTKHIENSLAALMRTPHEALHHYFPILCNQILCIVSGALKIFAYETQILDSEREDQESTQAMQPSPVGQQHACAPREDASVLASILHHQSQSESRRRRGSGLDMWLAVADTALRSFGAIFSQIERLARSRSSSYTEPQHHLLKPLVQCAPLQVRALFSRKIFSRLFGKL